MCAMFNGAALLAPAVQGEGGVQLAAHNGTASQLGSVRWAEKGSTQSY